MSDFWNTWSDYVEQSWLWQAFAEIGAGQRRLVVLGPCCIDNRCRQVATWRVFWPGQTSVKCTMHRDAWAVVAAAMGFALQSAPLDVLPEGDPSSVRFQLMEIE